MMGNGLASGRLKEIGVGGGVAVVVLWVVFDFLTKLGIVPQAAVPTNPIAMDSRSQQHFEVMVKQVDTLYSMHDRRDENGVPLWYVPRSLVDATEEQTEALRDQRAAILAQTSVLQQLANEVKESNRERPR